MGRMAILVDGGFYLKRAKSMKGEKTPKDRANELIRYCMAHTSHEDAERAGCASGRRGRHLRVRGRQPQRPQRTGSVGGRGRLL